MSGRACLAGITRECEAKRFMCVVLYYYTVRSFTNAEAAQTQDYLYLVTFLSKNSKWTYPVIDVLFIFFGHANMQRGQLCGKYLMGAVMLVAAVARQRSRDFTSSKGAIAVAGASRWSSFENRKNVRKI
ncbi:Polyprenol reductase [Frankliniella fusca]|uniref:Polyprenol reductase n=1 Tax=Frankliniella fusca TaxID=407009 RepID=A0AAE1H7Q2_9NEOP|nr:Polyprenol reductase [Frankliniella fusca]